MVDNIQVEKNYRDTVFRLLFKDKKNLLELYNGINGTHYTNEDDLKVNTLENAVYMNMRNDVSFVLDFQMNLFEHQSTLNPNMPLRDLFYVARLLEAEVADYIRDKSIYGPRIVKIPTPKFIVFYNGEKDTEDRFEYKLSDAFTRQQDNPELELRVIVININVGRNKELMEHCKTLYEYTLYADKIRNNMKSMSIDEAVEDAVNYCIENNILKEFLIKNRAEVMAMSIFECSEEEERRRMRNSIYEDVCEQVAKEVTERITKEVAEQVTKEVTEQVTKEVTEQVTKDVTEKVRFSTIAKLYADNSISLDIAATTLNMLESEFLTNYDKYSKKLSDKK